MNGWMEVFYVNHSMLLLSRFSRVRLCVTPETAAHQAPPSLGFSRQEHWVGCHFLLQCMKVKSESEVAQSCPTLSDSMDCSPPGSSVHGIFQARVLEWGAIAFSRITLIPLWKTNWPYTNGFISRLYSVQFLCRCIFMQIPHCLDYYISIVTLNIR